MKNSLDAQRVGSLLSQISELIQEITGQSLSSEPRSKSFEHLKRAKDAVEAKSRRNIFFDESLFADPAWDIMLHLFIADAEGKAASIGYMSDAAKIPLTTTLRWIAKMEEEGLIMRSKDQNDARKAVLNLTSRTIRAMESYWDQ